MSDFWNDPFCRPADVLIKSLSLNGDIWLTWLGSVLAAPMSAGTGAGYIGAISEGRRHDWKLFRVSHMPLYVEHTLLFTLWPFFFFFFFGIEVTWWWKTSCYITNVYRSFAICGPCFNVAHLACGNGSYNCLIESQSVTDWGHIIINHDKLVVVPQ